MAVINTTFSAGRELNKVFGFFGFFGEAGYASGNCLGGVLTSYDWRATVGVAALLGFAILLAGGKALVAEEQTRTEGAFDLLGAISSIIAVGLLLMGITDALDFGWFAPRTLLEVLPALFFTGLFFWRVYYHPHPLLPPEF